METSVYLALGARDGSPLPQLLDGVAHLEGAGVRAVLLSGLWETEPLAIPAGPPVLNAAALALTSLSPRETLCVCLRAEEASGRRRTPPEWRSLDLDILLYGNLVLEEADLTLPHPRFHSRRFNLAPLCEIAPDLRHPVLGVTMRALLEGCADPSWARRVAGDWAASRIRR